MSPLGFIGLLGWLVEQLLGKKSVAASPDDGGISVPPTSKMLNSSCVTATPPLAAHPFPVFKVPAPKTLEDLSWQDFELVIVELYRRQGYVVELCAGDGSDGGIDLRLRRNGKITLV